MKISDYNKDKAKKIGSSVSKVWQRPYASVSHDLTTISIYDAIFDKDYKLVVSDDEDLSTEAAQKDVLQSLRNSTLQALGRGTNLARDAYVYLTRDESKDDSTAQAIPYYQVSNPVYDSRSTLKKIPIFTREYLDALAENYNGAGSTYEDIKDVDIKTLGIAVKFQEKVKTLMKSTDGAYAQWERTLNQIAQRSMPLKTFVEDMMVLRIHDPESIKLTFYDETDVEKLGDIEVAEGTVTSYRYEINGFSMNRENLLYLEFIDDGPMSMELKALLRDGTDMNANEGELISMDAGPSNIQLQEKDTRITDYKVYKKVLIGSGIIDQMLYMRNPFLWTDTVYQKTSSSIIFNEHGSELLRTLNDQFMATSKKTPTVLILLATMLFAGGNNNADQLLDFYLRNERLLFKGCVWGDLVETKNFNQDLNQQSSPTFTNLLISKKGFNDNYEDVSYEETYLRQTAPLDSGFSLNTHEDLEDVYFDKEFYRNQIDSKDLGGKDGTGFATPLDMISPSSIIHRNRAVNNYFEEEILDKKLRKANGNNASIFNPDLKDDQTLQALKSIISDSNMLITPKGGNLVVEGGIVSPTIDGIWRLLKILLEAVDDYDDGNGRNADEQVLPFFHGLQTKSLIGLDESSLDESQHKDLSDHIFTSEKYTTTKHAITKNIGWKARDGRRLPYSVASTVTKDIVDDDGTVVDQTTELKIVSDIKTEHDSDKYPTVDERYVDILKWDPVYAKKVDGEYDLIPKATAYAIKQSIDLVYDYRVKSFFNIKNLEAQRGYSFTRLNKNCYLNDFTQDFIKSFNENLKANTEKPDVEEAGLDTFASSWIGSFKQDIDHNNLFYKNTSQQKQAAFRAILDDINFYEEDHTHEYNMRPLTLKHIERDLEEIRQNLRVFNQIALKFYTPKGWADKEWHEGTIAWLHRNSFDDGYARILRDFTDEEFAQFLNMSKASRIEDEEEEVGIQESNNFDPYEYYENTGKIWVEDNDRSVVFDDGFSEHRYLRNQYDHYTQVETPDEKYRKVQYQERTSKVAANTVDKLSEVYLAADGTWRYVHEHLVAPILKVRY